VIAPREEEAAPRPGPGGWRTLARLLGYVTRHRGLIVLSVLTMAALAAVDLLLPEIVKRAVDGPIRSADPSGLWLLIGAYVVVLLVGGAVRGARVTLSVRAGRQIGMSLRMDVFTRIQRMGLRFFDRHPVGMLTTRVTGDIEAIEEFFSSGVAAVFHDVLKLLLILGVLFLVNAKLALLVVAVVPVLLVVAWVFTRRSRRDFGRVRTEVAATNAFTNEAVGGVRVTRLFGREAHADRLFSGHVDRLYDAHVATVRNFAFFFPAVDLLAATAVALVLRFGAPGILEGTFTYGEFFQFYLLIDRFFEPIRDLSENLNMMLQAMVSGERVFKVADAVPEVEDRPGAADASSIRGRVTFEDVRFAYVEDEPVLRGLSFEVEAGTTCAVVGPTGAGKSSILNLISRFYDVTGGRVLVDGRDVRDYAQRSLRKRIAVVLQDVFLFTGSVLENIRLFDPSISRERVEAAARAVRADRVIARLPRGLDTDVQERGANFSLGERQLIAFARALVHDPAILVLDEATSSIDTETERLIQEGLETLRRGRTTIVVAHRLSTIRDADQILVLRRGQVVERGDHASLLRTEGLYRRLYELQVRAESAR
jgi:ATP-binding cassette subfamily B protein